MTAPLRRTLLCLLIGALAILAHLPLLGSGFVGGDLLLMREVATPGGGTSFGPLTWFADGGVRPIPAALLTAHAQILGGLTPLEPAVALPLRALSLAALLVGAAGAGVTLRRVLVPWLGESGARAAGWACAGLFVVHPVSVAAVARPATLGDLLALAAGAWCTAFFLRGRQQRRDTFLILAGLLAIAAGFASSAAWILPFACAVLEYTSAHRPRAISRKLGAAVTVALAAAALVSIEAALAWPQGFGFRAGSLRPLTLFDVDFVRAISTLGVLFVPAPSPGSAIAYLVGGTILLVACEPLLRAVRAAPRLWGWLVLGWLGAMWVALALARDLDVPPGQVELAGSLVGPAVLVCAALATASTALGGSRRTVMPLAIAAGLCILSDRTARLWPAATRELLALRADLERGLATAGGQGSVFVVGAPEDARGFGAPHELDLVGGAWPPPPELPGGSSTPLRRAESEALPYLVRGARAEELRRAGLAVLLLDAAERPALRLPPPNGDPKPYAWREDGRSDLVELDPIALTMVRVTPSAGISTSEPPRMRWRATQPLYENGSIDGAWVATEDGPRAVFDLGRSNAWLLGGTIRRVWFENQLLKIVTAEVLPSIELDVEYPNKQGMVVIYLPESKRPRAWSGDPEWLVVNISREGGFARDRHLLRLDERMLEFDAVDHMCSVAERPTLIVECRVGGVTVGRSKELDRIAR
ncbi:MAG: hypothetical protein NTY35_11880 [Planctomycetota bacterium]|nr:hypothetical protein [Planctomycetota bacterium]